MWFSAIDKTDRQLICSFIDLELINLIRRMQQKCRDNKQILAPELLSTGFQFKNQIPIIHFDLGQKPQWDWSSAGKENGPDFRTGQPSSDSQEQAAAEIELLQQVKFTQTNEELDTLMVSEQLVADPQHFVQLSFQITQASSFLKIAPEFVYHEHGKIESSLPPWFQPNKYNSMAKWLIMFIERAIWFNYNLLVKLQAPKDFKPVPTEGKLISFASEILPYWSELLPLSVEQSQALYQEMETLARQQIEVCDDPAQMRLTSYDVGMGLKTFKIKFNQLPREQKESQNKFVQNIGLCDARQLHDLVQIKLETCLC